MDATTTAAGLGAHLRRRRTSLGLTQADVAELAGTKQATVSGVERGRPTSRLDTVASIAAVLGLDLVLVDHSSPDEAGGSDGAGT